MNVKLGKRQDWFIAVSIWFLPVSALLSLSIVAWNHARTIVTFGAALLMPALCYANALMTQSNVERGMEPLQVVSSKTYLLGPPNNG